MSDLFGKLNLGNRSPILVTGAPEGFRPELDALEGVEVQTAPGRTKFDFVLAFAIRQAELDAAARTARIRTTGDAVVWVAYPKKSSKNYTCEFDRDSGWEAFGEAGFEPVRMVAIDADWSALRLRRVEFVRTMKRDTKHALSKKGKERTS